MKDDEKAHIDIQLLHNRMQASDSEFTYFTILQGLLVHHLNRVQFVGDQTRLRDFLQRDNIYEERKVHDDAKRTIRRS